jgi:hypothetical protein
MGHAKVIKTFRDPRTPCPVLGTVGEWRHYHGNRVLVRLTLPMQTTNNTTILPIDEKTHIEIYFERDEIEAVP